MSLVQWRQAGRASGVPLCGHVPHFGETAPAVPITDLGRVIVCGKCVAIARELRDALERLHEVDHV